MAHSVSGVRVLTWYDCEIVGTKAKYGAKFLCTTETEAQMKCVSFLQNEGDTLKSCKVTPTAPVGSVYTRPAEERPPPPWYNTEPAGIIVPERTVQEPAPSEATEKDRLAVLKKHLYLFPINVEAKLYTYKAEEAKAP